MDLHFIENIFGVSPDGGGGSLELGLIVMISCLAMAASFALQFTRFGEITRWLKKGASGRFPS